MKKLLLNIAFLMGASSMGFAQFTFEPSTSDATGVTFVAGDAYANPTGVETCGDYYLPQPTTSLPGLFYTFQNYSAAVYDNNSCTGTALGVGAGVGPGNDGAYAVPGSVGFGLQIASGYTEASWEAGLCVPVVPSFGFNFSTECASEGNGWNSLSGGASPVSVDLSATADRKIYVNYIGWAASGTPTFNTKLQLFRNPAGEEGAGAFGAIESEQPSASFILDGTARQLEIDFSTTSISSTSILGEVRQVSFLYYGTTITDNYDLKILGVSLGSADPLEEPVVSSTTTASSIASSKLYPNPVSDRANVELNLKSASSVKVTVSDLMGKEIMTIAEGTFSSLNESFSVANLNKGIYTVNYFVNGSAAKAEMLMVR